MLTVLLVQYKYVRCSAKVGGAGMYEPMRNALHALTAMVLRTLRPALSPCRSANSSPCCSATAKSDALMASAESSISSIAVVDLVVLVELELEAEVELEEEVELLEIDSGLESLREC